jgi:hypothetical protein
MVTEHINKLSKRLIRLEDLVIIGINWEHRIYYLKDGAKVAKAQKVVMKSGAQVKEAICLLDVLELEMSL